MTKNVFIFAVVIILIGVGVWLFAGRIKNNNPENISNSDSSLNETVPDDDSEKELIEMENGLRFRDIIAGSGREINDGDTAVVNYMGTLASGVKFDSSYDRGQTFEFTLGAGEVIAGWDIGVKGMKVGGKRLLVIPPQLGYGNNEVGGGIIPANSILVFEVELVGVK